MNEPSTNKDEGAWLRDPDIIVFAGDEELPPGAVELHSLKGAARELFGRRREDVEADWATRLDQVKALVEKTEPPAGGYEVDEITFELGFSAEGQVVFVAKAGVHATISITFRKHTRGQ